MICSRNLLWIGILCLVLFAACGHSRRLATSTPSGLSESSVAGGAESLWLTDALAEREAYERPADVKPGIFADLKTRLAQLLRDKAAGKTTSSISSGYTTVADLHFQQDSPEADVYLT